MTVEGARESFTIGVANVGACHSGHADVASQVHRHAAVAEAVADGTSEGLPVADVVDVGWGEVGH